MEVQTTEKKPAAAVTGKQTVTATEETSSVAERTKEVIFLIFILFLRENIVFYTITFIFFLRNFITFI